MQSGEIHIIEILQKNSEVKSIHLTEMMLAKWPEELFDHAIEEVYLEYVVCPVSCLIELFKITSIKRLVLIGIAETAEDLDEEVGLYELPAEIGQLHKLEELDISENSLVTLPDTLQNLQKLVKLNLGWNNFHPDSEFHFPNTIRDLDLSSNGLTKIPQEVFELPLLENLYLQHCQIKSSPSFKKLEALRSLDLAYNKMGSIEFDESLNLHSLVLKGCELREIPKSLYQMTSLKRLNLEDNHITDVSADIGDLSEIIEINLSRNDIMRIHQDIDKLQQLKVLNVDRNDLRSIPKSLGKLQNLTRLTISNNKIQELPSALYELKNLVTLNANWNVLSQIYPGIGKMKQLKHLNLHSCKLLFCTDDINELYNLEELTLSHNWLKKIPKMDQLQNLRHLSLSGLHELEKPEEELKKLFQLHSVKEISLSYWRINFIPAELKELKNLKRINLGRIPELQKNAAFWREEFDPIYLWF